jgi:hypothetical protein
MLNGGSQGFVFEPIYGPIQMDQCDIFTVTQAVHLEHNLQAKTDREQFWSEHGLRA